VHQLSYNTYQGPRSNLQVVVSTGSQQWSNVFALQVMGDLRIRTHDLRQIARLYITHTTHNLRQTTHPYITHTTNDRPMRQLFGAQHHNPQAKARKKKKQAAMKPGAERVKAQQPRPRAKPRRRSSQGLEHCTFPTGGACDGARPNPHILMPSLC
jgi:hypothetical protein